MGLKVKSNTKGMGPLSFLMGKHSYSAEGKHGEGTVTQERERSTHITARTARRSKRRGEPAGQERQERKRKTK